MDISLNHEDYKFPEFITDNSVEECMETEFSLPEYMPEILRIVKSCAEPKINSCKLVGERVTVDGVCELRMIYTAENGGVYSFSQSRPFTRHCENPNFSESIDVTADVRVSYVNYRATSTKRVEIKAGLVIAVNACCVKKQEVISVAEKSVIEQKTVPIRGMSLGCRKTRQFSMSDTVSLSIPSAFVISASAAAVCNDIKKINNKVMVKGETVVDICYVNADDKSCTERIRHTLPINQILEYEGMEERFTGNVILKVIAVDVMPRNEADGTGNAFDIALGVDATLTMWEEKELFVVCDAYAVGASIDLKKDNFVFYTALDEIRESYIFKDNFTISGEGVGGVCDVVGETTGVKVVKGEGCIAVIGSLTLSLLIKDSTGSFANVDKILDFRYERKGEFADEDIFCTPDVTVVAVECSAKGGNSIDVRAELRINGTVFGKTETEAVTDITESEIQVTRNTNAVTVYFPDKEESLWGIARRYNTTVSAIAAENEIDGDTTGELKIIFIPAV